MSNARLREALTAGNGVKEKGPPAADGVLSVTPDSPETADLRARRSAVDCAASSSSYLENEVPGTPPHELYGKFTWKIDNFSETSKRELRSNVFEVGTYKWYILVYPQGCDVCNHLSLFLCVADYDKLLPGWSHFSQFTIAVVNKDPKKSKYSDTLHRFCKKEHDWGWKKFMELSKVLDGFTVADTLIIKAQVQVIRDRIDRPFRCLDPHYRRELLRVYLTNVEGICRRFVEERRERLAWIKQDPAAFKDFWNSLATNVQKSMVLDEEDTILKGIVKRFFNEKEVTSTLVMDALFSGCRQVEEESRVWLQACKNQAKNSKKDPPSIVINAQQGTICIVEDIIRVLDRAANEPILPSGRDEKVADGSAMRSEHENDSVKDTVERDEQKLAELGKRTVEMYVICHIFTEHLEVAYQEAESLKRQEALIREEEESERLQERRSQIKAQAEREKRIKRKEKKKAKKEADRAKRDAEEAEQRIQQQLKQEEQTKKQKEEVARQKKLKEKEEAEHQRCLKEIADRSKNAQETRAITKKSSTAQTLKSPNQSEAQTFASTSDNVQLRSSMLHLQKDDRAFVSNDESEQPSQISVQEASDLTCREPLSGEAERVDEANPPKVDDPNLLTAACSHCQVSLSGVDTGKPDVNALRSRIKYLEQQLSEKELENQRLKAEIEQYRAREHICAQSRVFTSLVGNDSATRSGLLESPHQGAGDADVKDPSTSAFIPAAPKSEPGLLHFKQKSNGALAPARSSGPSLLPQDVINEASTKSTPPGSLSSRVQSPEVQGPSRSKHETSSTVSTAPTTSNASPIPLHKEKGGYSKPILPICHRVPGSLQALVMGPSGSNHPAPEGHSVSKAPTVSCSGHERSASLEGMKLVAGPNSGQQTDRLHTSNLHKTQGPYTTSQLRTGMVDHHPPIRTQSQPPCSSTLLMANGRTSSTGALFIKTGTAVLPDHPHNMTIMACDQRDAHSYIGAECRSVDPPPQTIASRTLHLRGGTSLGNLEAMYRAPAQHTIQHVPVTAQTAGYSCEIPNKLLDSPPLDDPPCLDDFAHLGLITDLLE